MKRKYYLIIATAVLATIIVLSILNYGVLLILYTRYFDPHNINVFFVTRHGKLIQNVSVSLFAFYPTPNGTVIKEIYHGHNLKYLSIPVSNLTWYAKQWLGTYNYTILIPNGTKVIKKHVLYNASLIIPSLIGFASYYVINQSNGTITIYTQAFSVSVSPRNITRGIGKTMFREFVNPIVKVVKINESSSSSSSNAVTPQQTVITTTVPKTISPSYGVYYKLDTYWIYPDNGSELGFIPLAIAYVTDTNENDYSGFLRLYEGSSSTSGAKISYGITLLAGALNLEIIGTSITFSSGSYMTNCTVNLGQGVWDYPPWSYPNYAEIDAYGQIAIANYTMYVLKVEQIGRNYYLYWAPNGNVTMFFIVALQVTGENGAYVPYLYWSQAPIVNVSDFFKGALVNTSQVAKPQINPTASPSLGTIQTSTSLGDFGGGIPLEPLIEYALDIGETVPGWVLSLVIPEFSIDIVPFTSNSQFFIAEITITTLSNNAYYIYYEETNITYNIEGYKYYIPMYYFYINYTS